MRKTLLTVVGLMVVMAMLLAPMQSSVKAQTTIPPQAGRQYEELPQEVIDAFRGGMSVEEFLAQNKGPIPMALWGFTDQKIAVVVEMDAPALISKLLADGKTPSAAQRSYTAGLLKAQEPLAARIAAVGGTVISHYTKVYNGVLALVPAKELNGLRGLRGVKAIHNAPEYKPTLSASVPLIQADDVWEALPVGYTGAGVDVAVIDTGIDYTHAALGGIGTPEAYATNNPDIIEEGSFPTAKVVGGYDLAGTNYDANGDTDAQLIPVPDPDPLDEGGHGSHVASTAAGIGVVDVIGKGVAPAANLYAFKVFGATGSTNLVVDALELAMDPNGDGDLSDRVDVINMSLGSIWGVADPSDPEQAAIDLISQMGTVVVVSAGNEGNSVYVTGQPAVSDAAISVAASTTGFITLPTIKYGNPIVEAPYLAAVPFTPAVTATLVDVDAVDGTFTGLLCNPTDVPAGSLTGAIALIQRGTCNFSVKINNAQSLGAVGAIVYNAASSANEFISMALDAGETLPAGHTLRSYGLALKAAHGTTVTVGPDSDTATFAYGLADTVASFSSRGPRGFDAKLKPEITAPGVAIFAAGMGTGAEGVSMNGTSMAAPHVAGVAALMKEAHPDWSVEQIKAAMMSTADDLTTGTVPSQVVPRTGAGRVNAFNSVFTETIAAGDPKLVSLSWGIIEYGDQTANYIVPDAKMVRLQNLGAADETYDISVIFTDTMADSGATLDTPPSVTVAAGSTGFIPVTLTLHPLAMAYNKLEEYYGFIFFTPQSGGAAVRVPFYFVPRPFNTLTETGGSKVVPANGIDPAIVSYGVTGSTQSSLWGFPLVGIDPNEADIKDRGDLRAVGMDYGGSTAYGEILSVAFNNWGGVHTPQPYYSETDLYLDVDQDGVDDYVYFNFNNGWFTGGDENNAWVVIVVSLSEGWTDLASPYTIYADFNSGLMEWYLPDWYAYFDFDTANSIIDYSTFSFDGTGAVDEGPAGSFDYMNSPYVMGFADGAPFGGDTTMMGIWLNSHSGFMIANPIGALLVDYNGKAGYGQAYPLQLSMLENAAPVAAGESFTTDENIMLTVPVVDGVLANDSDPDGDYLTAELVTTTAHGTLVLGKDGSFEYTPVTNWSGVDSFVYHASDGKLVSNNITVTITVNLVNVAPVPANLTLRTAEDTALKGKVTATDGDGDTLTFAAGTLPTHGTLVLAATGVFTYTPTHDYNGPDSFTFTVFDGLVSATGTVDITVTPINDAPVAPEIADVEWPARHAGSYPIPAFTDVDGDTLIYTVTLSDGSALPAWLSFDEATLTFNGTPDNVDVGDYIIKVAADDGHNGKASTTFMLTVTMNEVKIFLPIITN